MDNKNVEIDSERDGEPSVSSSDPNERKLARRLRIKRRLENAERLALIAEQKYEEPQQESSLIEETIESSEDVLRLLFLEGKELVSNVRVASDAVEVGRRKTQEQERFIRLEQLKEESASALKKLEEISTKWNTIVGSTGPLELYQHMKDQKAKCLELIKQKNDLIKSFQLELKISDEKFMKGHKTMYEELELITKRIDEQVLLMKKAYRIELDHIEESIDVTRSQILEKSMKSWLTLYNQREKDEVTNMQRKLDMVEKFHGKLYELHRNHQEKFRETRLLLESDIQVLEQELEQVKALCLLNSEKLDYNYQILKKREEENVYIKNHQKRRLNKLQDIVNTLRKKIEEKRTATEDEVKKLTKEVERYHANVLDTEKKADHLAQVNEEKFQHIWDMKDEEAKDLIKNILAVDKIVYEQILGVNWSSPSNPTFSKQDLPSYRTAVGVVETMLNKCRLSNSTVKKKLSEQSDTVGETAALSYDGQRLMRHILELIADQSGFLMEEKLDELLKPYTENERTFVRLDNVFAAIDIRTQHDMETMKNIFRPYAVCLKCNKKETSGLSIEIKDDLLDGYKHASENRQSSILQMRELEEKVSKLRIQAKEEIEAAQTEEMTDKRETPIPETADRHRESGFTAGTIRESQFKRHEGASDDVQCDPSHPLIIDKCYVLKTLKYFVSVLHGDKCSTLTGMTSRLEKKRYTVSRILTKEDIADYWETYRTLLPPKVDSIWNAVFLALVRYLSVLQDRHELNVKAHKLRRQNFELKRLLSHYKNRQSRQEEFLLPVISSVPDGPIDADELVRIMETISQ